MAVGTGQASRYDRVIRIEQKVADDAADSAGAETWTKVAQVSVEIIDALPSRGERLTDGINVAARPARVRIRFRLGITPAMRFVLIRWDAGETAWVDADRVMQIVSGPAEVGRREALEFMVEDYSSAGNG